jgi:predicted transcriptional regulator of viral defense system
MKDTPLSEKQEELLVYLVNNRKQTFNLEDAQQIYDTKKAAKSALKTISAHGFAEMIMPGQYRLKGIPEGLESRVDMP